MKKIVIALTAVAAFAGPALAADMAAKAPMRAAPVAYAPSWTGCYIAGGGGYGMYNNEGPQITTATGVPFTVPITQGGRGYLATGQVGCDYQFGGNWVIGAFADADWTNIRGEHTGVGNNVGLNHDTQTLNWSWAAGGRIGYLITPNLLTYFSAGYTEAQLSGANYLSFAGALLGVHTDKQRYQGYFVGAGDEYALNFLPGLFWKTEYRFADYGTKDVLNLANGTNVPTGVSERNHLYTHTIRSELVYRFNWGGPVAAKY